MFFLLSKTLDLLVSPLTWVVGLIVAAAPWRLSRPKAPKRQRILLGAAVGTLVVFSWAPVPNAMVAALEASAEDTTTEAPYDAIVLLGGMVEDAAAPANGFEYNERVERLLATFAWLRAGRARYAILSGGPIGSGGVVEAERLRTQLEEWGIEPERLIVEGRSLNTRQNALYSAEIARERGFSRLAIVTSAFHISRAKGCFDAVGLAVDTLPVDYGKARWSTVFLSLPRSQHFEASTRALRELVGRVIYWIGGYSRA